MACTPGAQPPESLAETAQLPAGRSEPMARSDPTSPAERIETIDVLRGVAVFGILMVNMLFFANPIYMGMDGVERWPAPIDQLANGFISLFFSGKFYSLFSMLFGLGMFLQAERGGDRFARRYSRRLLILMLFGAAHVILLWPGDILFMYALLGFPLLLMRRRSPRTILISAVIFHLLAPAGMTVALLLSSPAGEAPPSGVAAASSPASTSAPDTSPPEENPFTQATNQAYRVYSNGDYPELVSQRLADYSFGFQIMLLLVFPSIFGMFLFGLYAGKRALLTDAPRHARLLKNIAIVGVVLGLGGSAAITFGRHSFEPNEFSPRSVAFWIASMIGGTALSLSYAASLALLLQWPQWRHRLRPIAAVGRMALSNYLLQSVICTTLMYGYGMGLYGKVSPAAGIALAVTIYALQIPLSALWLRWFRFGPMEWLWRSGTYGRWQPLLARRNEEA